MESQSRLKIAIVIATVFMLIEIIGGYIASSLAIYSDAAHLLSDIAGFMIALYAAFVTKRQKCSIRTFGYDRAEVIGSIFSILCLWLVTIYLLFCASFRAWDWFQGNDIQIDGKFMFYTALFGVFVNIVLINVFHSEHVGLTHDHSHDHELSYDIIDESRFNDIETPCHDCENDDLTDHNHTHSHTESHTHSHDNHSYTQVEGIEVKPASVSAEAPQAAAFLSPLRAGSLKPNMSAVKPSASKPMDSALKYKVMDDFADDSSPFRSSPIPASLPAINSSATKSPASTIINERTALLSTATAQATNGNHDHQHNHSNGHDHEHANSYQTNGHRSGNHEEHTATPDSHNHGHGHGHGEDSNLKAAFLHVVTDMIQSIGVAIAGAVVWWRPAWGIVDPLCTFLFSALVMVSTLSLFRAQMNILMEGVPEHVCA